MHPVLIRLGSFELGTYGLLLAIGFFLALALAHRLARKDGLPPDAITDLAITVLLGGILGAKVLMVAVDLANGMPVAQAFSLETLRAGGAVHGGVIFGAAAFFWRMKKHHLPYGATMDTLVAPLALGQAIGRLGCFSAGCCYGTECHTPLAVTFTDPDALRFSGTPLFQPLHPVQIYSSLINFSILGVLLVIWSRRRFKGMVFGAYFILEGIGRMVVETWRGDLDRGVWFRLAWLSTGRLTALGFVLFGIAVLAWAKRHQTAAEAA